MVARAPFEMTTGVLLIRRSKVEPLGMVSVVGATSSAPAADDKALGRSEASRTVRVMVGAAGIEPATPAV